MRYVPLTGEQSARRAVNFDSCGNISRTGSVRGMQKLYGWKPRGQVRLGAYVYNIGPDAVRRLEMLGLVKD